MDKPLYTICNLVTDKECVRRRYPHRTFYFDSAYVTPLNNTTSQIPRTKSGLLGGSSTHLPKPIPPFASFPNIFWAQLTDANEPAVPSRGRTKKVQHSPGLYLEDAQSIPSVGLKRYRRKNFKHFFSIMSVRISGRQHAWHKTNVSYLTTPTRE